MYSIIVTMSCSNPLNYSVIEPIPIDELSDIIKNDTLFEITYENVQEIRERRLKNNDIRKAKFVDLTYQRVHEIVKLRYDNSSSNIYLKKIRYDWDIIYGKDVEMIDSISNFWKEYSKESSSVGNVPNYIKELWKVENKEKKGYSYWWEVEFILNNYIGTDIYFVPYSSYKSKKMDSICRVIDSETVDFLTLRNKK